MSEKEADNPELVISSKIQALKDEVTELRKKDREKGDYKYYTEEKPDQKCRYEFKLEAGYTANDAFNLDLDTLIWRKIEESDQSQIYDIQISDLKQQLQALKEELKRERHRQEIFAGPSLADLIASNLDD